MTKLALKLVISLLIAVVLFWWLWSQGFQIFPSFKILYKFISIKALAVYTFLFCIFHTLRAWRWSFLIKPLAKVKNKIMLNTAFSGFLAIQMLPLRTGEITRPYLLDKFAGISKSSLIGTIAIERVIDGLIVSLCLSITLFTINAQSNSLIWILRFVPSMVFSIALILLFAFYKSPKIVTTIIVKVLGFFHHKLANFALGVLSRFHSGLAALPSKKLFWSFVLVSVLYWGINTLAFFLLANSIGLNLPMAGAVAGIGILAVGILLPAGPGYFGNFQIAVLTALELYIESNAGNNQKTIAFIFALYVLQTGLTIIFGTISSFFLYLQPAINKKQLK